ncbi:MAG TPA: cysteine hydrolase family protein [Lapillicoccus sp.]|nr:cysteine hydrolase family protein [Lapillicoccus sp.]
MSTYTDRPHSALLVIDVQNGVVARSINRDAVVATISGLVDRARAEDVPVVWVQHSDDEALTQGSDAWQYVEELQPQADEALVPKRYGDAFEATDLESVLAVRGVGRVVITGAQTDECVRATLHGAFVRGYDTTLVSDAHTTEDLSEWGAPPPDKVVDHTNLYWQYQSGPGRTAEVVASDDLKL